jgi:hypothetical protein
MSETRVLRRILGSERVDKLECGENCIMREGV